MMYALFLQDEQGNMVKDDTAGSYLDAVKIVTSWVDDVKFGYSIVIKNLSGI